VLAFIPVDQCLKCARALHDTFGKQVPGVTLSVGIAIGHFMDPLEDLREYPYEAERAAKGLPGKNAHAVHVHPRSGAPTRVRGGWGEFDTRLEEWADPHLKGALSDKAAFDVRELARAYGTWPDGSGVQRAAQKDLIRLLARKRPGGDPLSEAARVRIQTLARDELAASADDENIGGVAHNAALLRVAGELIVARWLAVAMRQAGGKSAAAEEVG